MTADRVLPATDVEDGVPGIPADPATEAAEATEPATGIASEIATAIEPAPAPELTEASLEALLFVAERPLSRREISTLAGTDRDTVDARLGDLEVSLRARGIRLVLSGDRVELVTAPEAGALIARYVGADAIRLSQASLETLAIVAYRQPVTKAAVERIRGVDSDYSIRSLQHRRLVVELGRADAPGRPILYGTGFDFLERFGLTSIDDLPPLDADVAGRLALEGSSAEMSAGTMNAGDGREEADGPIQGSFDLDGGGRV